MKNHRSPSLAATPVLTPGIARASVWVGLGSRSWGIGWRSGLAAVSLVYIITGMFSEIHFDITTSTTTTSVEHYQFYHKDKESVICEIEDFVETHRCMLCVQLRSYSGFVLRLQGC